MIGQIFTTLRVLHTFKGSTGGGVLSSMENVSNQSFWGLGSFFEKMGPLIKDKVAMGGPLKVAKMQLCQYQTESHEHVWK